MPQLGRRTLDVPGAIGPLHFSPLGKLHRTSAEQLLQASQKNQKSLGGFLKWTYCSKYPQIIHFKRILHYHPVWGTPIYRNLHLAMRTLPLKMKHGGYYMALSFSFSQYSQAWQSFRTSKKGFSSLGLQLLAFLEQKSVPHSRKCHSRQMSSKRSLRSDPNGAKIARKKSKPPSNHLGPSDIIPRLEAA